MSWHWFYPVISGQRWPKAHSIQKWNLDKTFLTNEPAGAHRLLFLWRLSQTKDLGSCFTLCLLQVAVSVFQERQKWFSSKAATSLVPNSCPHPHLLLCHSFRHTCPRKKSKAMTYSHIFAFPTFDCHRPLLPNTSCLFSLSLLDTPTARTAIMIMFTVTFTHCLGEYCLGKTFPTSGSKSGIVLFFTWIFF